MKFLSLFLAAAVSCKAYAFASLNDFLKYQEKHINYNITEQHKCLSYAIYKEAQLEPVAGKYAVAYVILNRAKLSKQSICDIIKAPYQFSFDTAKLDKLNRNDLSIPMDAKLISNNVLAGGGVSKKFTYTHYHAVYVNPSWSKAAKNKVRIGNHIFYTLKTGRG